MRESAHFKLSYWGQNHNWRPDQGEYRFWNKKRWEILPEEDLTPVAEATLPQQMEMSPQIQAAVDAAPGLCGSEIFIITLCWLTCLFL